MPSKVKKWAIDNQGDIILAVSFFLVAITSFGLGRLSVFVDSQRKEPINIERQTYQGIDAPGTSINSVAPGKTPGVGEKTLGVEEGAAIYIGSKNSNKYHLPDCPGAARIKEKNKIWFSSRKEAENLGYTPADNCEGL